MVKYGSAYIGSTTSLTASTRYTSTGSTFDFHVGPRFRVEAKKNPIYKNADALLSSLIVSSIEALKYREIKLASADLLSIADLNTTPEVYVQGYSAMTSTITFDQKECYEFIYNIRRMSTPYVEGRTYSYRLTDSFVYDSESECYSKPQTIYQFRVPYTGRSNLQVNNSINFNIQRIRLGPASLNSSSSFSVSGIFNPGDLAALVASLGTLQTSIVGTVRTQAATTSTFSGGFSINAIWRHAYSNWSSSFTSTAKLNTIFRTPTSMITQFTNQINARKTARTGSTQLSSFSLPGNFNYRIRRTLVNQNTEFTSNFDTTLQIGLIQTISEATANSYMGNGSIKFSGDGNYIVQLLKLGTTYTIRRYELSADKQSIVSTNDTAITTDNISSTFREIQTQTDGTSVLIGTTNKIYFLISGAIRTYTVTNNVWVAQYLRLLFDTYNSSTNKRTIEIYDISNNLLNRIDSTVTHIPGQFSIGFNSTDNKFYLPAQQDGVLRLFSSANNYASGTDLLTGFSDGIVDIDTNATFIAAATPSLIGSSSVNVFMWRFITSPTSQWQAGGIYNFQLDPDTTVDRIPRRIKISNNGKRLFVYYTRGQTHPAIAIYDIIPGSSSSDPITVTLQARNYNYSSASYSSNGSYANLDMSDDKRYFVEVNSDDTPGALRVYTLR